MVLSNRGRRLATSDAKVRLEDGWSEHDWDGWKFATKELGNKVQLVAEDIFVTNPQIIARGIAEGVANSVLIKLNQIGTVTETLRAIEMARAAGYTCVCSHCSGETEDAFLADFTVASGVGQIKTGSLSRSDRVAKYNRLRQIEHELRSAARFLGRSVLVGTRPKGMALAQSGITREESNWR